MDFAEDAQACPLYDVCVASSARRPGGGGEQEPVENHASVRFGEEPRVSRGKLSDHLACCLGRHEFALQPYAHGGECRGIGRLAPDSAINNRATFNNGDVPPVVWMTTKG